MIEINTDKAPAALGPYSQALINGNMIFISGQIPVNPADGSIADTIEAQTEQSISNIKSILAECGLDISNVIKTSVFLADLNDFAAMNEIYGKHFKSPFPARSCVQVAAVPKGCRIEIECIAIR
ncbi:MAG: RidA family protein [Anaerovoracaceae bacterium]